MRRVVRHRIYTSGMLVTRKVRETSQREAPEKKKTDARLFMHGVYMLPFSINPGESALITLRDAFAREHVQSTQEMKKKRSL